MTVLSAAAGRALSRFGGQQLADRVAELAHLQRAEIKMLTALQRDMDRLLAEPLLTAGRLLDDASAAHRSDDDRRQLLHEARASLTRALSLDSDPLRLSAAALLLAGVWIALDSPDDASRLLREAHEHAVQAALALADAVRVPVPPQPGGLPRRLLLGLFPNVTWRRALRGRPKSMRATYTTTLSAFGRVVVEANRYAATDKARNDERTLTEIDAYVRSLRSQRIQYGESEEAIPQYRITLTPSVRAITASAFGRTSMVFHALSYDEVPGGEPLPATTQLPSDGIERGHLRLFPRRE